MLRALTMAALLVAPASNVLGAERTHLNIPVRPVIQARADGAVGGDEYAVRATDAVTGIEIFASADSANLYLALRSPGAGWLSIGLGTSGMNGAVMVIAHRGGQGTWTVEEHLGRSFFRHGRNERPRLLAGAAWQEGGRTVMEFAIPRRYAEGKSISAGTATPFILAFHKDKGSLSKHTRKTSGTLTLAN